VNGIFKHRPSPAMAVALTALVIAMGGTAVAAGHLVGGDKLIRVGSLSGNRLRNHTLNGTQINLSRLGQVPDAAHATSADTANTLPALSWVPLTLINGWADNYSFSGGSARVPAVAIDAQGIVHLRGEITSSGSNDVFAVMPAAFRPSSNLFLPAALKFNSFGEVGIKPDGTMNVSTSVSGAETALTSLDGITYALG
jgi:hypothetical protein